MAKKKRDQDPQEDSLPVEVGNDNHHDEAVAPVPDCKPSEIPTNGDEGNLEIPEVLPGSEIVLDEIVLDLFDATVEEPTYPAHEWQGSAGPPLVLPDDTASDEALIQGARQLLLSVTMRMRRTVQEWWLIGRHLAILKSRPENEGRWRKEILPEVGLDHETDHRLRKMSEMVPFEACLNYPNKTKLMRDIGILPPQQPKHQIELEPHAEVEEILGLGDAEAYEFGGGHGLPPAAPIEELQPNFGMEPGPEVDVVAEAAAQPAKVATKSQPASKPQTNKVAAKVTPQPENQAKAVAQSEEKPEGPGAEALILSISGASAKAIETDLTKAGLVILPRKSGDFMALLWIGDDNHEPATEKARKTLGNLRAVHSKLKVEAHYVYPGDLIEV